MLKAETLTHGERELLVRKAVAAIHRYDAEPVRTGIPPLGSHTLNLFSQSVFRAIARWTLLEAVRKEVAGRIHMTYEEGGEGQQGHWAYYKEPCSGRMQRQRSGAHVVVRKQVLKESYACTYSCLAWLLRGSSWADSGDKNSNDRDGMIRFPE